MHHQGQLQNNSNRNIIYISAGLISILLSIWFPFKSELLNPDAICYLESASTMGTQGLHAAMNLCGQAKWPFYSMLIFALSMLTKLSFIQSAFTLNTVFSLISVLTFIYITHLLGANRRTLWLAAAVILLAHEFNAVRELIIRDHGFWACYLISIAALIQYLRSPKWKFAITWSVSLMIATLFRIEGIFFLLLLPFTAWFLPQQKLKAFLQLNAVFLITMIAAILAYRFSMHQDTGRLIDLQFQITHGFQTVNDRFTTIKTVLTQQVLNTYSAHDANIVLVLLFLSWYIVNIVITFSVIYTVLFVYALGQKTLQLDKPAKLVLWGYILTNILVTSVFLIENLFVSKRYLVALTLVCMLWVPFALENLITAYRKHKLLLAGLVILLTVATIDIIHFNHSKAYIKNAGQWLAVNVPATSRVYSNDKQILYYSGHFDKNIFAKNLSDPHAWLQHTSPREAEEYLAIQISKKDLANNTFLKELSLTPIKIFTNKSGDEVLIYRIPPQGELL